MTRIFSFSSHFSDGCHRTNLTSCFSHQKTRHYIQCVYDSDLCLFVGADTHGGFQFSVWYFVHGSLCYHCAIPIANPFFTLFRGWFARCEGASQCAAHSSRQNRGRTATMPKHKAFGDVKWRSKTRLRTSLRHESGLVHDIAGLFSLGLKKVSRGRCVRFEGRTTGALTVKHNPAGNQSCRGCSHAASGHAQRVVKTMLFSESDVA